MEQALAIVHRLAPQTFISIEEVRSTEKGFFPPAERPHNFFLSQRKAR